MIILGSLQSTRKTAELGGRNNSEHSLRHDSYRNTKEIFNAFRSILDLVLSYEVCDTQNHLHSLIFIFSMNLKLLESNRANETEILRYADIS